MQAEPFDSHRWRASVELANAIFDYLKVWPNRPAALAIWGKTYAIGH